MRLFIFEVLFVNAESVCLLATDWDYKTAFLQALNCVVLDSPSVIVDCTNGFASTVTSSGCSDCYEQLFSNLLNSDARVKCADILDSECDLVQTRLDFSTCTGDVLHEAGGSDPANFCDERLLAPITYGSQYSYTLYGQAFGTARYYPTNNFANGVGRLQAIYGAAMPITFTQCGSVCLQAFMVSIGSITTFGSQCNTSCGNPESGWNRYANCPSCLANLELQAALEDFYLCSGYRLSTATPVNNCELPTLTSISGDMFTQ